MKLPLSVSFSLASAALAACAIAFSAASAAAQERVPPLVAASPVAPEPAARPQPSADSLRVRRPAGERFALRTVAGLGGWAGGAVLGAAAASQMEQNGYLGIALGGVAGAAIVAAAPSFGAPCTLGTRLWRGTLTATLGTVLGLFLGGGLQDPVIYTVPISTSAGAAVGADC